MTQDLHFVRTEFTASPEHGCECTQTTGKPLATPVQVKGASGVESLDLAQHGTVIDQGSILLVEVREVGAGNNDEVPVTQHCGKRLAQALRHMFVKSTNHDRQKFPLVLEDPLQKGQ